MTTEPAATPSEPQPTPSEPASLVSATPAPAEPAAPADPAATPAPAPAVVAEPVAPLDPAALTFGEGFEVADDVKSSFAEIMNDDKLTPQERAQKLVDLQGTVASKAAEAATAAWVDMQTTWQNEVRADTTIGGEKLAPTMGKISALLDAHGSPELRGIFDLTGAGNNIHMIRFLSKVADQLGEGGPVLGAPPVGQQSVANKLFPSMK